jgi:hypothetical protein
VAFAIEMGLEQDAVICDLAEAAQAEDLKAARIGEDGVGPGHEAVQAAEAADEVRAGADEEMICVGEQNLDTEISREIPLRQPLYRGLRPDRHEDRRFDSGVGRVEQTGAGACVRTLGNDFKGNLGQLLPSAPGNN